MARKVSADERIVIAEQIRRMLFSGEVPRKWTQASLGKAIGVSQQTILRCVKSSDGVTEAVRRGLLKLTGTTAEQLLEHNQYVMDDLRRQDPSHRERVRAEARDRAIEDLVRSGRSLERATDAVRAVMSFRAGDGEPDYTVWAYLAGLLIGGEEYMAKNRAAGGATTVLAQITSKPRRVKDAG